ncbi:S41 family peptidase [Thalassotalea atypica]|uniref:S41 family peptidase n=1 Tax=Thalassotalea atypica TaxID=2054316 RepID=UPI0025735F15|nr:S41 family peptidase [Thalassotalea atypica]
MNKLTVILWCLLFVTSAVCNYVNASEHNTHSPEVDAVNVKKTISGVIDVLEQEYLFPEKTKIIAKRLNQKISTYSQNFSSDASTVIKELSMLMRSVSGDGYLELVPSTRALSLSHAPVIGMQANTQEYGIEVPRILAGNIGYLKIHHFYQSQAAELQAASALEKLASTTAIIIDIRSAEGDSYSLVHFLMSYFVNDDVVLTDVLYEQQRKTKALVPISGLGSTAFKQNFPLFILTSAFVSGSGEFLSYTLKHLDKAVIVGEKTMGVALISNKRKVNDIISINVPIAMPIHPVTKSNWEGEGVVPDYPVEAVNSFDMAYELALDSRHDSLTNKINEPRQ